MPAQGEIDDAHATANEAASVFAPGKEARTPAGVDPSEAAFELINDQAGQNVPAPNRLGFVAAGAFLATAIILLLTLKQGTDSRQLLVGLIFLVVVNLLIAIVWTSRRIHSE